MMEKREEDTFDDTASQASRKNKQRRSRKNRSESAIKTASKSYRKPIDHPKESASKNLENIQVQQAQISSHTPILTARLDAVNMFDQRFDKD